MRIHCACQAQLNHLPSCQHDSRSPAATFIDEPRTRNRMALCALQLEGDRKLLHK